MELERMATSAHPLQRCSEICSVSVDNLRHIWASESHPGWWHNDPDFWESWVFEKRDTRLEGVDGKGGGW